MKIAGIILAAGSGTRFGSRKQYLTINSKTYYEIVRRRAMRVCDEVVVVGEDVSGGASWAESLFSGLCAISSPRVVILEAARPLVSSELINRVATDPSPAIALADKPLYTTHRVDLHVDIPRSLCAELHVPQAFSTQLLTKAFDTLDPSQWGDFTSATSIVYERLKVKSNLMMLEGTEHYQVFKVTYPYDHVIAEKLHEVLYA